MFGELGKLMKLAGEMKRRVPEMQARLAAAEFSANAGGGAVTATVNGRGGIVGVKIDPAVLRDGDAAMLEDLVKAAVSSAQDQAARAAQAAMKELTGGMDLPPGMEGLF